VLTREKEKNMEVGSTIVKAFKRFTIPRSTSAIGSFTTSNGIATGIEQTPEESAPSSSSSTSPHHKNPPISYVQNIRLIQQQNLTDSSPQQQQQHSSTPPLRENISSIMIHSTDDYTPKKPKV
jgi:hypothetical protein